MSSDEVESGDNEDTKENCEKVKELLRSRFVPHLRHEIGNRDIDERPRRKSDEVGEDRSDVRERGVADGRSDNRRNGGAEVDENDFSFFPAGMKEDAEVSDLLRDFVEEHGDCRRDPDVRSEAEAEGDDYAVDKVVHRVAEKHRARKRMIFTFPFVVAVIPLEEFFKKEEDEDSPDEPQERGVDIVGRLERLGEEVEKRRAHKASRGETHKEERYFFRKILFPQKEKSADEGDDASNDACD